MKIAFVCNEYPEARRGGQGVVVHTLARGLVAAGHQSRVIGFYKQGNLQQDGVDADGVLRRNLPRSRYPLSWIPARRRLYRELRKWAESGEIDIIEMPLSQGLAAGWGPLPVPVVVRLHGSNVLRAHILHTRPPRWHRRLEHDTLARADAVVGVCQPIADYAKSVVGLPPIPIIPNPIDFTAPQWQGLESRNVVFAGNLHPIKGLPELLEAWSDVHATHPDATLHLYGRGPVPALPAGVIAHGHVPQEELFAAFAKARCAVFPSRFEAFGLAALEAMACGCPTIAMRSWGQHLGESPEDLLFSDDIGSELAWLLEEDASCQRLSANAAQSAARFELPKILPQNLRFWEKCIADFARKT